VVVGSAYVRALCRPRGPPPPPPLPSPICYSAPLSTKIPPRAPPFACARELCRVLWSPRKQIQGTSPYPPQNQTYKGEMEALPRVLLWLVEICSPPVLVLSTQTTPWSPWGAKPGAPATLSPLCLG